MSSGQSAINKFGDDCEAGNIFEVRRGITGNVNINGLNSELGVTGLMRAVDRGQENIVKLLLQQPNIDLNVKSRYGSSVIHTASFSDRPAVLELLLSHPQCKSLNTMEGERRTPLMWAVKSCWLDNIKILLRQPNIDIGAWDKGGKTAEDWARRVKEEDNDILYIIGRRSAKSPPLVWRLGLRYWDCW